MKADMTVRYDVSSPYMVAKSVVDKNTVVVVASAIPGFILLLLFLMGWDRDEVDGVRVTRIARGTWHANGAGRRARQEETHLRS
jgi:hypothetical protein